MDIIAIWQALPANRQVRAANAFMDGINTEVSPLFVSDNTLIGGFGLDFEEYPAVAIRKGRTAYGGAGTGTTRLIANFGSTYLVRAVGTSLSYNSSGTTWTAISGTYADVDWSFANFDVSGPALLLLNPTNGGYYWNGTAITAIPQMPKGKYLATDNLRAYVAGVSGDLDVLYYSAFQNALDFTTAENSGSVQYYTASGQPISAIYAFGTGIWIFKPDSFAILYHTGDSRLQYRLQPISDNIGCMAYRTVMGVGPYLFWLGRGNVYVGAGDGAKEIGSPIRTYLENINDASIGNSFAFGTDRRYYLCIPTGSNTDPDTCLVYDYIHRKWLPYSISLGSLRWSAQLNGVSYTGDAAGQIFKMADGTTDNGTAIPWQIDSRPFDDNQKEAEKELYEMYIQGKFPVGTTLNVSIAPDDIGSTWYPVTPYPGNNSNAVVNNAMIVPLDVVPLCHFYRYRLSGTGPATIQEVQRYSRIQPIQI